MLFGRFRTWHECEFCTGNWPGMNSYQQPPLRAGLPSTPTQRMAPGHGKKPTKKLPSTPAQRLAPSHGPKQARNSILSSCYVPFLPLNPQVTFPDQVQFMSVGSWYPARAFVGCFGSPLVETSNSTCFSETRRCKPNHIRWGRCMQRKDQGHSNE